MQNPFREPLQIVPPARADERFAARPARKEAWLELGVFLLLVVPSMILSYFETQISGIGFVLIALSTIFRDLALVALILFFLWRNGEPWNRVGWTMRNLWGELALGVVLFIPTFILTTLIALALRAAGLSTPPTSPPFLTPAGYPQLILAFVLVVVVAIAEETIFRGYLILRFENLLPSAGGAILLSAIIFSLGHGYEGGTGVGTVFVMGVILALVYLWRRSLVAPATIHFLQDFLVIVLIPLLALPR